MLRPKKRPRGKQVGTIMTADGGTLRIMKYKLPQSTYKAPENCGGPRQVKAVDLDFAAELVWGSASEHGWAARWLYEVDPSLPPSIVAEAAAGGNWQGFSGREVQSILYNDAADGILLASLRAPFIRTEQELDRFCAVYFSVEGRSELASFARHIPNERPSAKDEKALEHMLDQYGLRLWPQPPKEGHASLLALQRLVAGSTAPAHGASATPPQHQPVSTGDCRGCSN